MLPPPFSPLLQPHGQGAEGFLRVQYTAIAKIAVWVALGIFASYYLRPDPPADDIQGIEARPAGKSKMTSADRSEPWTVRPAMWRLSDLVAVTGRGLCVPDKHDELY